MDKQKMGDWQGKMIGRYQLTQLLGRGATSEVWLATDTQLRRQVALKILPTALGDNRAYLQDFSYEARAAASLEHPHILGVHDFGEQELEPGEVIPYLVMPYVSGGTLRERLGSVQGLLPIQESLRYLHQAAQAIDYAHSKQILHRDIKPANMLLRDGWLLLADFGIAKVLHSGVMRGQTYAGSGTPEYMAPEQIMGQAQPASDRYSLAVVAYQLFTGRQPFHAATPAETVAQQLQAPLPPPRQLNPQIPPAVEHLLMMALSRRMELRPPSCEAMVNALQQAWMGGIQVDPDPESTLLAPWSKRLQQNPPPSPAQPYAQGPSSPALPPVASSPLLPTPQQRGAPPITPGPVSLAAQTVTDASPTYQRSGPFADNYATAGTYPPQPAPKVGRRAILIGSAVVAAAVIGGGVFALEALRGPGSVVHTGPNATPTPAPGPQKLIAGVPVLKFTGHTDEVWTATWDPTGRYLLTAGNDGNILLWDVTATLRNSITNPIVTTSKRSRKVAGLKFTNLTNLICWSPDGQKLIVSGDFTDKIYVLEAFGSSDTPTIYNDADARANGNSAIYNGVFPGPLKDHFTIINSHQAQVWKIGQTDKPETNYDNGSSSSLSDDIGTANWSPDGQMLAGVTSVLSKTRQLLLWKSTDRLQPQAIPFPLRPKDYTFFTLAETMAWSPTDPRLLLTSNGDVAVIWNVQQGQPVLTLGANTSTSTASKSFPVIGQMSWSPNGRYVAGSYTALGINATVALSPQILVWDVQELLKNSAPSAIQTPTLTFGGSASIQHTQSILDLEWSPDGRYLATSSLDNTVIIWKVDGSA